MQWQTKTQLKQLLSQLVSYPSVTETKAEADIITFIYNLLIENDYYKNNPQHLKQIQLNDGRQALIALVKSSQPTTDTTILVNHIDVVDVDDYGALKDKAFSSDVLTDYFHKNKDVLPKEAQEDLQHGEWIFGRGSMDMKAGTTLHLSMLERAMTGEFNGHVLVLFVPDEEVSSQGMIRAVDELASWQENHHLNYRLCINSEPMFRRHHDDQQMYVYEGSLGKILPGFLCFGKETHVGEPFQGINANLMLSILNHHMELNDQLVDRVGNEVTPPPVSLMNRDLKEAYSVKTTVTAVSMYNLLYMTQTVDDMTRNMKQIMYEAKQDIESTLQQKHKRYQTISNQQSNLHIDISILTYDELYDEAVKQYGQDIIDQRLLDVKTNHNHGERDMSVRLVEEVAYHCQHLAPMMVLFYSPPFYPAVSSHGNRDVDRVLQRVQAHMSQAGFESERVTYFNGISDLSFIGEQPKGEYDSTLLATNMPLQQLTQHYIPKSNWSIPTINVGPYGKDPHQWTERLELTYSFDVLPDILADAIKSSFAK
ncbi:arginine utilization protein RocB [Alkalibacillus flavidus]|uniref:Arginine utilization protein RocB n=1 Tax=Alkalibacillus flavidus TaxID=546021 RepID=A0ABV2KS32_9BACI